MEILRKNNKIFLHGEFLPDKEGEHSDFLNFKKKLSYFKKNKELTVFLETPGGYGPTSLLMGKYIYQNFDKCICHILEKGSHSNGIFFMMFFNKRFAQKDATFSFHYPVFDKDVSLENQEKTVFVIQDWIASRSLLSINEIDTLMKSKKRLYAREALDVELIHKIK